MEKQDRLKESMKMMGLANWLHWCAWFTKNLLFLIISVVVMVIVLKVKFHIVVSSKVSLINVIYCTLFVLFCFHLDECFLEVGTHIFISLKNYTEGSNVANHAWQNNHSIDFDNA